MCGRNYVICDWKNKYLFAINRNQRAFAVAISSVLLRWCHWNQVWHFSTFPSTSFLHLQLLMHTFSPSSILGVFAFRFIVLFIHVCVLPALLLYQSQVAQTMHTSVRVSVKTMHQFQNFNLHTTSQLDCGKIWRKSRFKSVLIGR